MRFGSILVLAGSLALSSQAAQAQDAARAADALARGDRTGALQLAEPACLRADLAACDVLDSALLSRGQPGFDPARYVRIMSQACQQPGGAVMCGNASLVASGSTNEAPDYTNWSEVGAPGRRGCALGDISSCYAMAQVLMNDSSPYRDVAASIPFSRAACEADILTGCFTLMAAVQELPDPALGTYADEYLLSFEKSCQLGESRACSEVSRARLTQQRAARFGAADAVHMIYVDNGFDEGNWGGSVIHAIEESGSPAVIDYAVGRVAAAGQMTYVRQEDLPLIASMFGSGASAQAARSEMDRRARLDAQLAQRNAGTGSSSSPASPPPSTGSSYLPSTPPPRSQTCTESYASGYGGGRIVTCE